MTTISSEPILSVCDFTCYIVDESAVPETVSFSGESVKNNVVEYGDNINVYFNFNLFSLMARSDSIAPYFYDVSTAYENKHVCFYVISGGDDKLDGVLYPGLTYDHRKFLHDTFENCFFHVLENKRIPRSFYDELSAAESSWFMFVLTEYLS